ncbi:MAG: amidohydrolase family protein [Steroidobacteraceae bacterium]
MISFVASVDPTLVWVPTRGGMPRTVTPLAAEQHGWYHERYPVDPVYFTSDPDRLYVGLTSWRWDGTDRRTALTVFGPEDSWRPYETSGVLGADGRRALIARRYTLFEVTLPVPGAVGPDTLDLERARIEQFGAAAGAAQRWGTALGPWVSWSRDGRRVLFGQGGTLFLGEVRPDGWTKFQRVEVSLPIPADVPRGTVVLSGARLITMRGNEMIERGDLVVRDNRIAALGIAGQVAIPKDAQVLDMRGATILPGYVDLHDHMWLPKGVHPGQCWQCLATLAYGVTAGRDPQPSFGADVFAYRERERTGDLLGPRVFSTGIAYSRTDPPVQTLEDARDAVRPNAEYFGSETFKVYSDPAAGRRARQLLAMALVEQRLNATVEGGGNAALDLTVVIDGFSGFEHLLPIRIYDDVATFIARSGTTHTQTFGASSGGWQYMFHRYGGVWEEVKLRRFAPPSVRASVCDWCANHLGSPELDNLIPLTSGAARIAAKGGLVGIGSHGDIPGLGFHYEMWLHALGGMPNHEILRSATIVGAAAVGHASGFGSLEIGKLADLQVLDKNPLEDIRHTTSIRYVMKNGRLYQAEDLTELWPRHKPLAPFYLWEATPTPGSTAPVRRVGQVWQMMPYAGQPEAKHRRDGREPISPVPRLRVR